MSSSGTVGELMVELGIDLEAFTASIEQAVKGFEPIVAAATDAGESIDKAFSGTNLSGAQEKIAGVAKDFNSITEAATQTGAAAGESLAKGLQSADEAAATVGETLAKSLSVVAPEAAGVGESLAKGLQTADEAAATVGETLTKSLAGADAEATTVGDILSKSLATADTAAATVGEELTKSLSGADEAAAGVGMSLDKAFAGATEAAATAGVEIDKALTASVTPAAISQPFTAAFDAVETGAAGMSEAVQGDFAKIEDGAPKAAAGVEEVGKAAEESGAEATGAESGFGGLFGVLMGAQIAGSLFTTLKDKITEFTNAATQDQQVTAQTARIVQNMGGVTGVTADQIEKLANKTSGYVPIARAQIQAGENVIAQYSQIGSNIFPQVVTSMTDMVAGMQAAGQRGASMAQVARILGQALQDPATGMTRLRRAGVDLTAQQQQQVKDMMKVNDVAGAQQVILQSVAQVYHDAGQAAGSTFAGQMQILKNRLEDVGVEITSALLPIMQQFTSHVLPAINSAFAKVADVMPSVIKGFQDFASAVGGPVVAAVEAILKPVGALAETFGTTLVDALKTIKTDWDVLTGNLSKGDVTKPFSDFQKALISIGDAWRQNVAPALSQLGTFIKNNVEPALKAVGDFIQKQMGPILIGVATVIAMTVIPAFVAWAIAAGAAAVATVAALAPILVPIAAIAAGVALLKKAWDDDWGGIREKVAGIWSAVKPVLDQLKQGLETFAKTELPKFEQAWTEIKTAVMDAIHAIEPVVKTVLTAIATFIDDHGKQIEAIVKGAWEVIGGVIKAELDLIVGAVKIFADLITGNWSGLWNDIKQLVGNLWNDIINIIAGAITIVMNAARIGWDAIRDVANAAWTAIKQGVSDAWHWIEQEFQDGVNAVTHAFDNAKNWLYNAGKDIIDGLKKGIEDAFKTLLQDLENMVKSIPQTVMQVLGINSPARVMIPLGEGVTEGFALGITNRIPDVMTAMQRVAGATTTGLGSSLPNLSLMGGMAASAGVGGPLAATVPIIVNVGGQELTRVVMNTQLAAQGMRPGNLPSVGRPQWPGTTGR